MGSMRYRRAMRALRPCWKAIRIVVALLPACTPAVDVGPSVDRTFPEVDDLPSLAEPPDPLVGFASGEAVASAAQWDEERAPELRALFAHYVYGQAPTGVVGVGSTVASRDWGDIEVHELDVAVGAQPVEVVVFLPAVRPAPVLLGLNKCGNHTISTEPEVRVPEVWPDPACGEEVGESGRGSHAAEWPIVEAVARGFAVVSVAQASLDPDDPDEAARAGGLRAAYDPEGSSDWGTVAAWSWGLSRVVDALEERPELDLDRLGVFGHSRRGKAALWAAANDPRIDWVWAHQSGIVGAALNRGSTGETIAANTLLFPHWFTPEFASFANQEERLPVDQHCLIALIAPRPLLISDGTEDAWANPPGATEARELALPVFELLDAAEAEVGRIFREGGHEMRAEDWESALDFVEERGI